MKQPLTRQQALASLDSVDRSALRLMLSTGGLPKLSLLSKLCRLGLIEKEGHRYTVLVDLTDIGHPSVCPPADTRAPAPSAIQEGGALDISDCPNWPDRPCRCNPLCLECGYRKHTAIHCGTMQNPRKPYGHVYEGTPADWPVQEEEEERHG